MALNLRPPQSERYDYDLEPDHDPNGGLRLGAATPDWDREDAGRNPAGMTSHMGPAGGGLRRWIRGGFGVLALAGFVGVLWYAYEWGLGGGETVELPTVKAEAGPEKEKPSDPGGLQVPYQDQLVLNESETEAAATQVERLLPPPEAPLPELSEIAPSYDEPVEELSLDGETGMASGETDTLQPAGELPSTNSAADTATDVPAAAAVPELPAAPIAQDQAESQAQTSVAEPAQTQATQPTETQTAATQPATTQAPAAQASGDFAVQLVSLKDPNAAQTEWRRLQGIFPQLLGDKSLLLQTAEVAGIGKVYRLRAGPFASKGAAAKVCAQLKSKQQDCLVVSR